MNDDSTNTQISNSIFLKLSNAGPVEVFPITLRNIKYARMRTLAKQLNLDESDIADCFDIERDY
jgi:hypothetical protein